MDETFDDYLDEAGNIRIPEGRTLVDHVEKHTRNDANDLAYRYIDYSRERDGEALELTWHEFGNRLRAVAARLQQVTKPGDRVAILAPQGLDYVVSFFSAIYAGTIAVPLFDPDEPGHTDRLYAVLRDCKPAAILTGTSSAAGVRQFFRALPAARRPRVIAVDAIPDSVGETWVRPDMSVDDIAYLQYTSGSTRTPAGVEITHRAVGTNVLQMIDAIELQENSRGVTWLPLFHDMGLLTVILPALGGKFITIMSPSAFVRAAVPLDQGTRRRLGRRRHVRRRAELRVRARGRARTAEERRIAGSVQRHRPHQRQRAGHRLVDEEVQRGLCALRPAEDRDQALLRHGRGDAVRVRNQALRRGEDHLRRPRGAQRGPDRAGRCACRERDRTGVLRLCRAQPVGGDRRPRDGHRAPGPGDRRDLAARRQHRHRLLGTPR